MNRKLGPGGTPGRIAVDTTERELPEAAMDHYWHPDREGVERAPDDFMRDLKAIDRYDKVRIVRPPPNAPTYYKRAWLLWYRKPEVTHYLSPGWMMLRDWRSHDGEPLPLDQRVFSYLFSVSAEHFGGAKKYWDHCVEEMKRDKARREKIHTDGTHDRMEDYRQFMQIKSIGAGNKFALHHDGTNAPSRGQANWLSERRKRMIPGELLKDETARREKALIGR